MKRRIYSVCVGLMLLGLAYGVQGGRYDQQILAGTNKILDGKSEFKDVHADVEDGIVTLAGTVELESSRSDIEYKIRRLRHVAGVRNQVVLYPPAPDDQVLFRRLYTRLQEAGYEDIKIKVHNGAVVLTGVVRTQRDRNWAIQLAWLTDGVKEVDPQLSVASF